jgi:hypothetical protein
MNFDLDEAKRVAKDAATITALTIVSAFLIIGSAMAFAAGIAYIVSEILFM